MSLTLATSSPVLTLRSYQEEAVEAVLNKQANGVMRQLVVMATGLGKTIVFSELARRLGVPTLVLAHRDELINQAVDKIRMVWPDVGVGIVKAESNQHNMPVVVASVQTLSRPRRLEQVSPSFGLVIVDEAHHAAAATYKTVLQHFGCLAEEGITRLNPPLLVGVTATPDRGDKVGLGHIFEEIAFERDIRWGILNGYLSDLVAVEVMLKLDLDNVKKSRGDYQDGDLGRAMIEANAPELIVEAWQEHASDRKTLAFSPTVAMAAEISDEFNKHGIRSCWISGETPWEERREYLRAYARGEYQVLSNCGIATEGFDEPSIECVLMARPTRSRGLYCQVIGRGTRRHPGKKNCMILDVVGVARKHSLVKVSSLIGVDAKAMAKGKSASAAITADIRKAERALARAGKPKGSLVSSTVDLWVEQAAMAWVQTVKGTYALSVANGTVVTLEPVGQGWGVVISRKEEGGTKRSILSATKAGLPVDVAQGVAEDWARKNQSNSALTSRDAAWRSKKATPNQLEALKKWHITASPDISAGEASDLISAKVALVSGSK